MYCRIDTVDIDALKKSLSRQAPSISEIYTITLKAGDLEEEVMVQTEFKPDGSPSVTSISSKGPFELSFDILHLHG